MNRSTTARDFDGGYYAGIGDFIREKYLDWGFTRGTVGEVDFLIEHLRLPPGARILDVGCGTGRHSLELARRGFAPTGIDISQGLIDVARAAAKAENLQADFRVQDARELSFRDEFHAAICLCEGAFGLAGSDAGNQLILNGVARALVRGAPLILTAINAYSAVRQSHRSYFDIYTCTTRYLETVSSPQGEKREVEIFCSAFTFRELKLMLERAGLAVEAGYGSAAAAFSAQPLALDSTEIMMISRRP